MKKPGTTMRRNGTIRCAIYTRKSSEEGLEQEFNSLQAQREAGWRRNQPHANRLLLEASWLDRASMPTVSQGFDYQMPGKTDRCLSQKGLRN